MYARMRECYVKRGFYCVCASVVIRISKVT